MTEEDEAFEELSRRQGDWGLQGSRKHQIMRYAENVENKGTSMNDKDAMKLALFALDIVKIHFTQSRHINEAIAALKERLAQPEQEPVAWGVFEGNLHDMFFTQEEAQEMARLKGIHAEAKPLYTTPPQREPLTNGEIYTAYITATNQTLRATDERLALAFARAIEAAHGIKENT